MKHEKNRTKEPEVDRRKFLSFLGWGIAGISGLLTIVWNVLYLKPAVSYGPAMIFRVGKPGDFPRGIKEVFENEKVVVVREPKGFAAISVTCTHLGCTVRTSDAGFECPCHGSQFDTVGNVTGGPAPKSLPWYQIALAPNGELEVNKEVKVPQGTYLQV